MQAAIKSHAKLYFLLDDGELLRIILRMDASDYGYGAYLLQILADGRECYLFSGVPLETSHSTL